jgi:hypothetical protein
MMAAAIAATDRLGPVAPCAARAEHHDGVGASAEQTMSLLIAYPVALVIAQAITIAIGLLIERMHSPYLGLTVFIPLYFFMFWVAWRVALWITKPKLATTAEGVTTPV